MSPCPSSRARLARRGVVAAGLVAALGGSLGSATASAVPVSLTLNYTCNFPLLKPEPLALKISSDIPDRLAIGTTSKPFAIQASAAVSSGAAFGLRAVDTASIEGTAVAAAVVTLPDSQLPVDVDTTIEKTTLPATGGFTTNATGSTPPLKFAKAGDVAIDVGDLVLTLTPRMADGQKTGLDEFETECFLVPGQNTRLANIKIGDGGTTPDTTAPTAPSALSAIPNSSGTALSWAPSTDAVGVTGYDVYQDGTKVQTVTGTSATVNGLDASKTYKFKVQARDAANNLSPFSQEIDVKPTGPVGGSGYNLAGTARIKTLTTGTVPLSGSFDAAIQQGAFSGTLALNPVKARLVALGFIPVTASLQFVTNGPTTGTLSGTELNTTSKIRTKLPQVSLFGTIPLAGGTTCQTRSISTVNLKSTAFTPAAGGTLAGTFAISDLSGCGILNGIVSPLTAGGGNTLSLKSTPKSNVS